LLPRLVMADGSRVLLIVWRVFSPRRRSSAKSTRGGASNSRRLISANLGGFLYV